MRLVCPNCSAQYEVDAGVIPDEGRDVLCSNCGHAWFQLSARQLAAAAADEQSEAAPAGAADDAGGTSAGIPAPAPEAGAPAADADADASEPDEVAAAGATIAGAHTGDAGKQVSATGESAPEGSAAGAGLGDDLAEAATPVHPGAVDGPDGLPDAEEATAIEAAPPSRRVLDDDMLSVLREEAERETEARRAEGSAIEMQTELGLPEANAIHPTADDVGAATVRALRRHDEGHFGNEAEEDGGTEPPAPQNRKALLPDIEEINSTLTASTDRRDLPPLRDDADRQRSRSGFRAGFSVSLLVAVLLLLLYMSAPRLAQSLPGLAPALDRYVASVDAGRIWLDARLRDQGANGTN